jgi:acetolactate synthase-1/2/3 large subunit
MGKMTMGKTISDTIVERLAARGVRHMFGVPGGDCNLDIIEAGARVGVEFVLTRGETAAAIIASVIAELTGTPGVVMTTRGPGLANGVNGVAYASLDRAPLLVIADNYEDGLDHVSHQRIDQAGLLRPLLKGESRLTQDDPAAELDALLDTAMAQPPGPVYLEINGPRVRSPAIAAADRETPKAHGAETAIDSGALSAANDLLAQAKRPIVVAGLQSRAPAAAAALRRFVARHDCPVLATYKAKGVVSDADPRALGFYIGGAAEHTALEKSDVIILYGFDPIEGPAAKWRYDKPLIELTEHRFDYPLVKPEVSIVGPIATSLDRIGGQKHHAYAAGELSQMQRAMRARGAADAAETGAISPQQVVDSARAALPAACRITVDAGAHMLPVLHLWESLQPNDALVSRGLATMGFALPAAIASAIVEPERPVVAFTGDGGLLMCASELATAAQRKLKLVVVVFNDSCLTLIEAKQRRRQLPNAGVNLSPVNFASIAEGFGCAGFRVERPDDLQGAITAALAADGPAVVDAVIDPHAYYEQIISLRG